MLIFINSFVVHWEISEGCLSSQLAGGACQRQCLMESSWQAEHLQGSERQNIKLLLLRLQTGAGSLLLTVVLRSEGAHQHLNGPKWCLQVCLHHV